MNLHQCFATKNECYIRQKYMTVKGLMLHSTGVNNPWLKRYVQPDDGLLGTNTAGNSFNEFRPGGRQVMVHGFIGKLKNGSIATYQTAPWDMACWHSGKGSKGSANNMGYIGVEICEDALTDASYFAMAYKEAVELFAYLCNKFGLNPTKSGVVICHSEGHAMGIASNHGDVMHWFPKFGKSMDTFRADVKKAMDSAGTETKEEDAVDINKFIQGLTAEQAYEIARKANQYANELPEPDWSKKQGSWEEAISQKLIDGTGPERYAKRDEIIAILDRKGLL